MAGKTQAAPVETKVVAAGSYGAVSLVVVWIITTYVYGGTLPPELANFLPGFVGIVCAAAAGWASKHTPRVEEVVEVVRAELAAAEAAQAPAAPAQAAAAPSPAPGSGVTVLQPAAAPSVTPAAAPAVQDQ